jgi:hypothetical protein
MGESFEPRGLRTDRQHKLCQFYLKKKKAENLTKKKNMCVARKTYEGVPFWTRMFERSTWVTDINHMRMKWGTRMERTGDSWGSKRLRV